MSIWFDQAFIDLSEHRFIRVIWVRNRLYWVEEQIQFEGMEAVNIKCSFKDLNCERRKEGERIPEGKLSEVRF